MNSTHKLRDAISAACEAQIIKAVLAKMVAESAKLFLLGDLDEEIYTHCARLMAGYRDTIGIYEQYQRNVKSSEVSEIIDGIITILVSRLREFEEISGDKSQNPISEEKRDIILRNLDPMSKDISAYWTNTEALYKTFIEYLTVCRGQLNDLNGRPMVQLYLAMMEDEWEILSSIIKIQVSALEQAAENADNVLEKVAVHKILSLLREAYQHFGRASTEITAAFHPAAGRGPEDAPSYEYITLEDFIAFLAPHSDISKIPEAAAAKAKVEQEAEALFGRAKMDFFREVYRFRRMVNDEMMLADEMVALFVNLRENWPMPEVPRDTSPSESNGEDKEFTEILRGIGETIEIKIESLQESIGCQKEECFGIVKEFSSRDIAPAKEEIMEVKEEAWRLWMQDPETFTEIIADMPVFTERAQKLEKNSSRCMEDLTKKLTKFKREILLYEISTYEEIIYYSISRLRELENPSEAEAKAIGLADETLEKLAVLLKKNSIEVIRPKPHDAFNPKEHEVLMAETNPSFKKGEIVKLMNSGYRQGETILLRANVIAAR